MNERRNRERKAAGGFSLIELMAVIVIISMLSTVTAIAVMKYLAKSRYDACNLDLIAIEEAIGMYSIENKGRPPESLELIKSVLKRSNRGLKDQWDNDYLYEVNGRKWKLTCLGEDGQPGGEGYDKDLVRPIEDDQPF